MSDKTEHFRARSGRNRCQSQEAARLVVAPPLADALARGLVVIQYRAENLASSRSSAAALDVTGTVGLHGCALAVVSKTLVT
jgi:hypothetical protein